MLEGNRRTTTTEKSRENRTRKPSDVMEPKKEKEQGRTRDCKSLQVEGSTMEKKREKGPLGWEKRRRGRL